MKEEWRVSLHGGHSGEFCDHASGTLREMIEAAVLAGYHTFGISEHVPRAEKRFMYDEELAMGWSLEKVLADFERYMLALEPLAQEYEDRITLLKGFEGEVVPTRNYVELMKGYRSRKLPNGTQVFDYFVGSVHYVDEWQIDGSPEKFAEAVRHFGSLANLAVRYYETIAEMIEALKPDVVGHFDLVKKCVAKAGLKIEDLESQRVVDACAKALEAAKSHDSILDLNTAGWRKGLGEPYPSPKIVQMANEMGIPFCFGDDSHRRSEVGAGIDEARNYLLSNGVETVAILTKETASSENAIVKRIVKL